MAEPINQQPPPEKTLWQTIKNAISKTILSIKDFASGVLAPLISKITPNGHNHKVTAVTATKLPLETQRELSQHRAESSEAKKGSRKIYLTDLDDTIIDWKSHEKSSWDKFKHRLIHRHPNEKIEIFKGAEDFIKHLNENGVRTAIVTNKEHNKSLKQARQHLWGGLFDRIIGHDRSNDITRRKHHYNLPKFLYRDASALPLTAIEKLLGEKPKAGMEKLEVVFIGDKPMDIGTATALDKALKKFNPESSCTGILINSQGYGAKKLSMPPLIHRHHLVELSRDAQGNETGAAYRQIQSIVDKTLGLSPTKDKSKEASTAPDAKTIHTEKAQRVEKQSPSITNTPTPALDKNLRKDTASTNYNISKPSPSRGV